MKKLIFIIAIALSASAAVQAIEVDLHNPKLSQVAANYKGFNYINIVGFNDSPTGYFALYNEKGTSNPIRLWSLNIGSSTEGGQHLYLHDYGSRCAGRANNLDNVILKVEGRNVMFYTYCSEDKYRYYTPKTDRGGKYVVNAFSQGRFVTIENLDYKLMFSTDGFAKAWNDFGGDAI
ncbi:hypothetical protein MD588_23975 [Photobacterium sp. SDRW27]|uniref:hypothetical protein n=1 Tax=Photobacterium obscurum TaxID=2829490 RepID=UPI002243AB2D|nr:hypothetical protein [Photobacterium obscurum]MCW8331863.1 hypothetical protein [Photobacterium obscurum]